MIEQVLMVCVGNICRSPMAEGMFRAALPHPDSIRVASAGVAALVGRPAEPFAIELLAEQGIDISGHRARQIDLRMIRSSDLILVMEPFQGDEVLRLDPFAKGKVFELGQWNGRPIPDPYWKPRDYFEMVADLLKEDVARWIERL